MSSSFTLGDGDGPRPPTSPQSGSRAGAANLDAAFRADIDRIVAAGEQTGWDVVVDLAARGRCPGVSTYGHGLTATTVHLGCCDQGRAT